MSPGEQGAESSATTRCGVTECVVFVLALACGTACSICSKTMMQLRGEGITGEIESFEKPLFQTFGMFVGMCFGLVMHWFVLFFKINFPGYDHSPQVSATVMPIKPKGSILPNKAKGLSERDRMLPPRGASEKDSLLPRISSGSVLQNNESGSDNNNSTPLWMYFFLAIPRYVAVEYERRIKRERIYANSGLPEDYRQWPYWYKLRPHCLPISFIPFFLFGTVCCDNSL